MLCLKGGETLSKNDAERQQGKSEKQCQPVPSAGNQHCEGTGQPEGGHENGVMHARRG